MGGSLFAPTPLKSYGDRLIASLENHPHQDAARKTIPMLLETCQRCGIIEPTQLAYILATAGHAGDFGASLVEPTQTQTSKVVVIWGISNRVTGCATRGGAS